MNPLIQFKTTTALFVSVLVLGCFVLLPQMRASPDEGPSLPESFSGSNTFDGFHALIHQTSKTYNSAFGWMSLTAQTTSTGVTGVGAGALLLNTADFNTAVGVAASLSNTTGTNNTAVGGAALLLNATGDDNTAVGFQALQADVSGVTNAALGVFAAQNTTNSFNTALGGFALRDNTTGTRNTAVGAGAMETGTAGNDNTAIGELAGNGLTGASNTILGSGAGTGITSGGNNVCIGGGTGSNTATASGNVYIGHGVNPPGPGLEFNTIRIADSSAQVAGTNSTVFIGNIFGATCGAGCIGVGVNANGQLGTTVSSERFKTDIQSMGKSSEAIFSLRPVTFHLKGDETNTPQWGLIAEEVVKVNPALIVKTPEGKILTVRYDQINGMLLNEFLKEHKKVEEQQASITQLKIEMQTMVAQLKEQAAQIQKVSARLEVSKTEPQVVLNKP